MPSLRSYLWRAVLKSTTNWSLPLPVLRKRKNAGAALMWRPRGVAVETQASGPVRGDWLIPDSAPTHRCMLYLHGGGYATGSLRGHRPMVARIAKAAHLRAFVLDYRLAPEHPFPAALNDAVAAYRWLLRQGFAAPEIVIAGDSAGGGLALATMLALRNGGESLPGQAVLLSPVTDLTCSGPTIESKSAVDPRLTRAALALFDHYAGQEDRSNPLLSPLLADLRGLPPMLLHVGSDEILLSDSTRLADRALAAGVTVELRVWYRMWHAFHSFAPLMREANEAIADIGSYLRAWSGRGLAHTRPRVAPMPPAPALGMFGVAAGQWNNLN